MSEPVTALGGATYVDGIATVEEMPLQGMLTLRGDLGSAALKKAAKASVSLDIPAQGQAVMKGESGLCWMSPDEVLVLCPYADAADTRARFETALAGSHAMVVDVSDARASFRISGPLAREVVAKLAPVDMAPGRFEAPMFRRTRLAQVPAALWMDGPEAIRLICFRSQARYVFDLLTTAAQPGSSVGLF